MKRILITIGKYFYIMKVIYIDSKYRLCAYMKDMYNNLYIRENVNIYLKY